MFDFLFCTTGFKTISYFTKTFTSRNESFLEKTTVSSGTQTVFSVIFVIT